MKYFIFDSATGEELGGLSIDGEVGDYYILERLCEAGYLDGSADDYEITEGGQFVEPGDKVVEDEDGPVLLLEPEEYDGEDDETEDDEETEELDS